jgi:hypothetical protein
MIRGCNKQFDIGEEGELAAEPPNFHWARQSGQLTAALEERACDDKVVSAHTHILFIRIGRQKYNRAEK